MRKIWDLPGGIHPEEHKKQSLGDPIGELPLPAELIIPLNQHIGARARPVVRVGDMVLKGQMIGEPGGFVSTAVHASSSGTVTAIEDRTIPHPSGMTAPCIVIETDGEDRWIEHQGLADYRQHPPAQLVELIRQAGIAGLGGAGFPSAVKLQPRQPIDTLIINATECEPYITADDALIQEKAKEIIEGIKILAYLLGEPQNILIGIEDNKPKAYAALEQHLSNSNIELVDFHTKYPSGGEKQLIYILTGKEVPSGGLPADIGIVCQNIGTTHAIYRAIIHGEPLISRVTTLTGEALQMQQNFNTLIGTPVQHLLDHCGFDENSCSRLVMGGPMMGFTLTDTRVPVIKTTNCILAPTVAELPPPPPAQPCIRCGMCAEACPVNLLPQQMYWYAQSQDYDRLQAYSLFDCIECGACSYVCPSAIPLVQYYRAAKGEIRELETKKIKSDHARERFEFNKQRKEREEAEKAVKREARKKAAEQARKEAAGKPASPEDDLVKAALARVQQQKSSPEEQRERLERAIAKAQSRVEMAQQKLAEVEQSGTDEQVEQAQAHLVEVEHRLQIARDKLQDIESPDSTERDTSSRASQASAEAQTATMDAAAQAIARAQQKADSLAEMSEMEKLKASITSLQGRIEKANAKLQQAELEGSEHVDALRNGLEKLQTKLAESESRLADVEGN